MDGGANESVRKLLEQKGYRVVRSNWRMEIEMHQPPLGPLWPYGISMRTFVPGQDERATFEAMDEVFQDHWGHIPGNYEEWCHWMLKREDFDPTLWFLACDGNEIAAGSLCMNESIGWVDDLAVRRPWRRAGLGMALLLHSFGEFYRRGIRKVGLHVDSQNLTGATRLYDRAGMHIARRHNWYEKELRPGVELSTQELSA